MADDDFFSPPAFDAAAALQTLQRHLRSLRVLAERGSGFELRGAPVIQLKTEGATVLGQLARRPGARPEWQLHRIANAADLRRFIDQVKQHLQRWDDE